MSYKFCASDVCWVYGQNIGAIAYIFNKEKTRVKSLQDDVVLTLQHNGEINKQASARRAFSEYYNEDLVCTNYTAMFANLNLFQKVTNFGLDRFSGETKLNIRQINYLTENYNKKMRKLGNKQQYEEKKASL